MFRPLYSVTLLIFVTVISADSIDPWRLLISVLVLLFLYIFVDNKIKWKHQWWANPNHDLICPSMGIAHQWETPGRYSLRTKRFAVGPPFVGLRHKRERATVTYSINSGCGANGNGVVQKYRPCDIVYAHLLIFAADRKLSMQSDRTASHVRYLAVRARNCIRVMSACTVSE